MAYSMTDKDVKTAASRAGADISHAVNEAGEKMSGTVESAKSAAVANFDKIETAIRRNPVAAASIAGGVGFLLAVLARR
jgi:ElaB/YqjD/DUF883 family membrane-anchored ribosome-binding protein